LRSYHSAKCDCGKSSVPDPAGGAYISAPPDPLASFKGPLLGAEGEGGKGKGGEGKGIGEEGQGVRGEEGREVGTGLPIG